jgi:hypothetical protein
MDKNKSPGTVYVLCWKPWTLWMVVIYLHQYSKKLLRLANSNNCGSFGRVALNKTRPVWAGFKTWQEWSDDNALAYWHYIALNCTGHGLGLCVGWYWHWQLAVENLGGGIFKPPLPHIHVDMALWFKLTCEHNLVNILIPIYLKS